MHWDWIKLTKEEEALAQPGICWSRWRDHDLSQPWYLGVKKGDTWPRPDDQVNEAPWSRMGRVTDAVVDGVVQQDFTIAHKVVDGVNMFAALRFVGPDRPPPVTSSVIAFTPSLPIVAPTRGRWQGTYEQYLRTPEFAKIAARARKEWGYQCLLNCNHTGPVEMHHRSYRDVPFLEDWQTLIPLCEECHARYHDRLPAPPRGLFDDLAQAA